MPVLGETMEEGTIVSWNKNVGERVEKGEALLSVESDKATLDVESFSSGYLRKILCAAESTVKIGEVIAILTDTQEEPIEE
jgi:pyruvate dehydrogenase E2 component (dihydrolipoamide acetyltransferase)